MRMAIGLSGGGHSVADVTRMEAVWKRRPLPAVKYLALVVALAVAVAGCDAAVTADQSGVPTGTQDGAAAAKSKARKSKAREMRSTATGSAADALMQLPVKGRAPKTGYTREQFGGSWIIAGGCNIRDRILARDLTAKRYVDGCRVEAGELADPYTARNIRYVRGASEVDIDHVVALSDAWQKGAQQWTAQQRVAFANDPLNLLAVDAAANRQKGDGDAATWLPSNKRFRCAYVARQVAVKRKYRAWVTRAERDAITRVLAVCPGEKLPKAGARIRVPGTRTPVAPAAGGGGRVYANCTEARAAGVAPIMRGSPAYDLNRKLDRDGDGIACE
jgi:hypothetical protein